MVQLNSDFMPMEGLELRNELDILLEQKEIYWKQRAKINWLIDEDRNTKYFHHKENQRRRKKLIEGLLLENRDWIATDKEDPRSFQESELVSCPIKRILLTKKSCPKVLHLNLIGTPNIQSIGIPGFEAYQMQVEKYSDRWNATQVPNVTPVSSPEHTSFTSTDRGTSSISSLILGSSPKFLSEIDWNLKKDKLSYHKEYDDVVESDSDADTEILRSSSTSVSSHQWVANILSSAHESQVFNRMLNPMFESLDRKISVLGQKAEVGVLKYRPDVELSTNVRDMVSLTRKSPLDPPPLYSVCQHKAPVFGKLLRWFTYAKLEHATRMDNKRLVGFTHRRQDKGMLVAMKLDKGKGVGLGAMGIP
ncbi:hypothetical protein ACH5RR_029862 [Cinchona calisaya]|uniref:Uncharacterized protein n=1 Tax=Cinchona calisaya TaxID=153742 RepID=A0ABD2YV65_9GENT